MDKDAEHFFKCFIAIECYFLSTTLNIFSTRSHFIDENFYVLGDYYSIFKSKICFSPYGHSDCKQMQPTHSFVPNIGSYLHPNQEGTPSSLVMNSVQEKTSVYSMSICLCRC